MRRPLGTPSGDGVLERGPLFSLFRNGTGTGSTSSRNGVPERGLLFSGTELERGLLFSGKESERGPLFSGTERKRVLSFFLFFLERKRL